MNDPNQPQQATQGQQQQSSPLANIQQSHPQAHAVMQAAAAPSLTPRAGTAAALIPASVWQQMLSTAGPMLVQLVMALLNSITHQPTPAAGATGPGGGGVSP